MPSQTTKSIRPNSNIELFELELTKGQLRALSKFLPQGFSLQQKVNRKKSNPSDPTKKIFTNDGTQVIKKSEKNNISPREGIIINKHVLREPAKRKISAHFEYKYPDHEAVPTTSSKAARANNDAIRKCHNVLQKLKKHPSAIPFLYPVDVQGLGLIDYYDVVKEPMDLSTVENKLKTSQYQSISHFVADIRKIWNNAFDYNMEGSPIYLMTQEMSFYFEKLFKGIENGPVSETVRNLEKKVEMLAKQITQLHQRGLSQQSDSQKLSRQGGGSSSKSSKLFDKPLTFQEKKALKENITKLSPEYLRGIWDIVSSPLDSTRNGQGVLEFDIELLPVRVARELERYVKNKVSLINRGQAKKQVKESIASKSTQVTSSNVKTSEIDYDLQFREDEVTTQHHSVGESDGKADLKDDLNVQGDALPSNSSDSSFISDSESEKEEDTEEERSKKNQQDLANFLAGGHGSMLNSFIVK